MKDIEDIKVIQDSIYILDYSNGNIMKISLANFNDRQKTKLPYLNAQLISQFKDKIVITHDIGEGNAKFRLSILNKDTLELIDIFTVKCKKGILAYNIKIIH